MQLTARSLILDLLTTLGRGSMPVRALVEAGGRFGIAENAVRVALARLVQDGTAARDERGRYTVGAANAALSRRARGWRHAPDRLRTWSGDWLGVHTAAVPRLRGRALRQHAQALRLLGFRSLSPGLELRPDNLAGGVAGVRTELLALGLHEAALVIGVAALGPDEEQTARGLWDAEDLVAGYRESCRDLAASEARLPSLPEDRAMVESFLLGGRVIRQLVLDPLLPEPIVPAASRDALVEALRRYDRAGRAAWAPFMRSVGAPHRSAPVDVHGAVPATVSLEASP